MSTAAVRRGQTRRAEAPCSYRPCPLFRAEIRGILSADDLESLERVYFRLQRTGSHPAIQGDGQAGRVSGNSILTIVLAGRAVSDGCPFLTSERNAED